MSNEKQLALALTMYKQDNDGYFPVYPKVWTYVTLPYYKNKQIIRCPDAPQAKGWATHIDHSVASTYAMPGGPTVHNQLLQSPARNESTIAIPSRTVMFVESRSTSHDYYHTLGYGTTYIRFLSSHASDPEVYFAWRSKQHLGGSNVAFVDGHVKWIKYGTGKNWIWQVPST